MKVGIIGMGVIGKAQAEMFTEARYDVMTYDIKDGKFGDQGTAWIERWFNVDFVVICVGTPEDDVGACDLSQVEKSFNCCPQHTPILVRSSVPPGTTDDLMAHLTHMPEHYCYAPEFMGENPAHPWQRAIDVPFMILGGQPSARDFFRPRLAGAFPGKIHECSVPEAEMAKYAANLYWATRVTYANEMQAICDAFGLDYEKVRAAWLADPRMDESYTAMEGHPAGFGGRCWPKDLSALIHASRDAGYSASFLQAVKGCNQRFQAPPNEKINDKMQDESNSSFFRTHPFATRHPEIHRSCTRDFCVVGRDRINPQCPAAR